MTFRVYFDDHTSIEIPAENPSVARKIATKKHEGFIVKVKQIRG